MQQWYEECDTICVVRHPVDRIVSEWHFQRKWGGRPPFGSVEEFRIFVDDVLTGASRKSEWNPFALDCHLLQQKDFVSAAGSPRRTFQHVLKIETWREDFRALMQRNGLPVGLPGHNLKSGCNFSARSTSRRRPVPSMPRTWAPLHTLGVCAQVRWMAATTSGAHVDAKSARALHACPCGPADLVFLRSGREHPPSLWCGAVPCGALRGVRGRCANTRSEAGVDIDARRSSVGVPERGPRNGAAQLLWMKAECCPNRGPNAIDIAPICPNPAEVGRVRAKFAHMPSWSQISLEIG